MVLSPISEGCVLRNLFSLSNLRESALTFSLASNLTLNCLKLILVSFIQLKTVISVLVQSEFKRFCLSNVELESTKLRRIFFHSYSKSLN